MENGTVVAGPDRPLVVGPASSLSIVRLRPPRVQVGGHRKYVLRLRADPAGADQRP